MCVNVFSKKIWCHNNKLIGNTIQHTVSYVTKSPFFAQYDKNPKFSRRNPLSGLQGAAPQAKGVRLDKVAKLIDIRGPAMGGRLTWVLFRLAS